MCVPGLVSGPLHIAQEDLDLEAFIFPHLPSTTNTFGCWLSSVLLVESFVLCL